MGMHFGIVATKGTSEDLLQAIVGRGYQLERRESIGSLEAMPERVDGESPFAIGDRKGQAFLMDPGLIVSADPDAVLDASRSLGRIVVGAGAETTSGTYWLTAANGGSIERLYWHCLTAQSQPFERGTALSTEATTPLDDPDGAGLMSALSSMGFDYDAWAADGPFAMVAWAPSDLPPQGSLVRALNDFANAHPLGPDASRDPVVVQRGVGAFDLLAPGTRLPDGSRVSAKKKGGIISRLFGGG